MPNNDDPFLRPDATRLRPRPGGGRRPSGDPPRTQMSAPPLPGDSAPIPPSARALIGIGLNPLVRAATPLLLMTAHVREAMTSDVAGLRRNALDEIRQFEEQARAARVSNEV